MIFAPFIGSLLALAAPSATLPDAQPALSLEAQAKLRCAAAFALVSHGQENGDEAAKKWPDMSERGREFFVRALAGLMDETGLDREGIGQLVSAEAQKLWDKGQIDDVMPACLVMLDGSGL